MKTGTGNLGLDLLVLLAMIVGGTWLTLWYLTSPHDTQRLVIDGTMQIVTLALAQPGLILGAWILVKSRRPLRWRVAVGISTIATLGIALPLIVVRLIGHAIAAG